MTLLRLQQRARVLPWPWPWHHSAPELHVLSGPGRLFLAYRLADDVLTTGSVVLVEFQHMHTYSRGTMGTHTLDRHSLRADGVTPHAAHIVENSEWIEDLIDRNSAHPRFDRYRWAARVHYVLTLPDETMEIIAEGYRVTTHPDIPAALLSAARRMR
jgi:hypothetical protein